MTRVLTAAGGQAGAPLDSSGTATAPGDQGREAVAVIEPAPPSAGGWARRLLPFIGAHRRDASIAFGVSVVGVGFVQGATPWVTRHIVDNVIVTHRDPLAPWLAVLVVFGVANFASGFVRRYFGGRVSLAVQYDLRNAIYERLQRLDFASHDEMQTGQLVSRASSDVGLLQGMLGFLPVVVGNLVQLVVSFAFMVWFSPLLTLVALAAVPALAVVALRLRTTIFPSSWDNQQWTAEVAGVVDEAVTGVRVVKAFAQEERELDRLTTTAQGLFASRMRTVRLQSRFTPALQAVPALAQVGVLALGGWLAIHHRISLGTFLAFSSYMVQLVAPVRMFPRSWPSASRPELAPSASSSCWTRTQGWSRRLMRPTWPPCVASSSSTTCASATCVMSPSSTASPCGWSPARPSRSSGRRGRASRR